MKQITKGNPHCASCILTRFAIFAGPKIWVCCIQKGKCFLKFLCIFCLSVSCKKCMKSTQGIFQGWLTYDGCSLDILSACDMVIWDALLEVLHIFCWLLWAKWGVGLKWASEALNLGIIIFVCYRIQSKIEMHYISSLPSKFLIVSFW